MNIKNIVETECSALSFGMFIRGIIRFLFKRKQLEDDLVSLVKKFFKTESQIYFFQAGRMGLFSFLKTLNLNKNDEAIIVGYTCVVVPNAFKYLGIKVSYADIDKSNLSSSFEVLSEMIDCKTKVLVIPHNFGLPNNCIDSIRNYFPNLIIIEDCAHTFGSCYNDNIKLGLKGDASFFSFEYNKPITVGFGGMLLINSEKINLDFKENYDLMKSTSFLICLKIIFSLFLHLITNIRYFTYLKRIIVGGFNVLGFFYQSSKKEIYGDMPKHYPLKMNVCLYGILIEQLLSINEIIYKKECVQDLYYKYLRDKKSIQVFNPKNKLMVRYPIIINDIKNKDSIVNLFKLEKITVGNWFNDVIHPKGSYRYMYNDGDCPVAENVADSIINLPISIYCSISSLEKSLIKINKKL
ncbi:MAG: DegT/DnrJ/EryC1/StrS family aminotransferase [Marinifilaceae bacterium]